jgi:hypothetical protein
MKKQILAGIVSFWLCTAVSAQAPANTRIYVTPDGRPRTSADIEAMRRVTIGMSEEQIRMVENERYNYPNEDRKSNNLLKAKAMKYLVSTPEIRSKYQDILKLPGTGVVKLLSPKLCSSSGSDKKEKLEKMLERCAADFVEGHGRYFSFRKNVYVDYDLADVGFKDNRFFSLGAFSQGVLAVLGDVGIEDISLTSKGVDFLADFTPSANIEVVVKESKQFEEGLKAGGINYQKVVDAEKDKTYILRVVAYNPYYPAPKLNNKSSFIYPLGYDVRDDIVVAFRVVEKNDDGSVVLLWKELKRTEAPKILLPVGNTESTQGN